MHDRVSAVDRIVKVIPAPGLAYRVTVDCKETAHAITPEGIKAVNAVLDSAPTAWVLSGTRRERVSVTASTVTYGGSLEVPPSADAAAIAELIADDVRAVLARPGHLTRVEEDATAA